MREPMKHILILLLMTAMLSGVGFSITDNTAYASGSKTILAFTSDVHNSATPIQKWTTTWPANTGADRLETWITNEQRAYNDEIDYMGFCGDLGATSGVSESQYWANVKSVIDVADAKFPGKVCYTTGNHELEQGNIFATSNDLKGKFKVDSEVAGPSNCRIYCMGSRKYQRSDNNKINEYVDYQVTRLDSFLKGCDTSKPVFILSHYPLHIYGERYTKMASDVIDVINDAADRGVMIVFLWGHNHTNSDSHYDKIYKPNDSLECEIINDTTISRTIKFTYAAAGCMSDQEYSSGSASVKGKGLIVEVNAGNTLTFTYYNANGGNETIGGTQQVSPPQVYTVQFDANGHGTAPISQTVASGRKLTEPSDPVADEYIFGGWFKEPDCINKWDFSNDTVTENRTLYAKWTADTTVYSISYNLDGGSLEAGKTNPTQYKQTSAAITLNNPVKSHYTFKGWTGTGLSSATTTVTIPKGSTGDRSYTATWTPDTYKVTFYKNDSGATGSMSTQSFTYGTAQKLKANTFTKAYYNFTGWNTKADGSGTPYADQASVSLTADMTLYAQWAEDTTTYTISYDLDGGTLQSGDSNPTEYRRSTADFTLKNPVKSHYSFAGWTGTDLTSPTLNVTIKQNSSGNRSYKATWTPDTYKVTFDKNDSGATGTMTAQSFTYGTAQNLKPNTFTKTYYNFTGWNTKADGSGTPYADQASINPDGNMTLYAQWTEDTTTYTISYDLDGGALQSGDSNPSEYRRSTADFTLKNPVKPHYSFAGWTGTDLTAPTMNVTIKQNSSGNRSYKATWTPDTYTVTFDKNDSKATGTMTEQKYSYGTAQKLKANAFTKACHDFTGWNTQPDGSGTKYADQTSVSLTADMTLYAQWEEGNHDWAFTGFTWTGNATNGYTAASAEYICRGDSSHAKAVQSQITSASTEPTCVEDGRTTYTATVTAAVSPDRTLHTESKDAKIVRALGHDIAGVPWEHDKQQHWHICNRCHQKTDITAHTWDEGVVTLEPTEDEPGKKLLTCTVCNETKEEAILPLNNRAVVEYVAALITALPDEITLENEQDVLMARAAYDAMTPVQKDMLDRTAVDKLTAAEAMVAGWKQYEADRESAENTSVSSWKVKAQKGKKAAISWETSPAANGYQIWYSTSKSFKKNVKKKTVSAFKTKLTIKKLKAKKTYYIKIRTYQTVTNTATGKSTTVYGKWSGTRKFKAKK